MGMTQFRFSIRTDLSVHATADTPEGIDQKLIELADAGKERLTVIRSRQMRLPGGDLRWHEDMAVDAGTWLRVRGVMMPGDLTQDVLHDMHVHALADGVTRITLLMKEGSEHLSVSIGEGTTTDLTQEQVRRLLPALRHFAAFGALPEENTP